MDIQQQIEKNRSLKQLSTFGIGGNASYYLPVTSIDQMKKGIAFAKICSLPYFILGRGSNCLFSDEGYKGIVLHNKISFFERKENEIRVGGGVSFSHLGSYCTRNKLSGLEFASGIPGSVGGAIFMNAGAHGHEVASVLKEIFFLTEEGEEKVFSAQEITFGYRFSSFQKMKGVIVGALFSFAQSLEDLEKERKFLDHRRRTQPLDKKNAGSIFRNPSKEIFAGALIEKCGLKGVRIGGAKISELHANFIVNEDNATCQDVLELMQLIQSKVREQFGIFLEKELRCISCGEE